MTPFALAVVDFVARRRLIASGAQVLVALSGGPDSCALLLALVEAAMAGMLPMSIAVAHFHHGVRGQDADEDAAFCAALCAKLRLPLTIGLGAVPKKNGGYSSAVARRLRYAFLEEAAMAYGADVLATAHTADDQAETVLGRVLRGTSVDGLSGIPAQRQLSETLTVVRPIREMRRTEVEDYCALQGIRPRHDPSNDKERYTRTRLRRLLPELARSFNPQVYAALNRLAFHAEQDADLLAQLADDVAQRARVSETPTEIVVNANVLRDAHPALCRRVLLQTIRRATGEYSEEAATAEWVERIAPLLTGTGRVTLPGAVRVVAQVGIVSFRQPEEETPPDRYTIVVPVPGRVEIPVAKCVLWVEIVGTDVPLLRERRSWTVDLGGDALAASGEGWVVRSTVVGERFAPLGLAGKTRLVRDMLAEADVPLAERGRYPVLARRDTDEILWIPGVAQAESTRVRGDEKRARCRMVRDGSG